MSDMLTILQDIKDVAVLVSGPIVVVDVGLGNFLAIDFLQPAPLTFDSNWSPGKPRLPLWGVIPPDSGVYKFVHLSSKPF